jgi:hypothetical protein
VIGWSRLVKALQAVGYAFPTARPFGLTERDHRVKERLPLVLRVCRLRGDSEIGGNEGLLPVAHTVRVPDHACCDGAILADLTIMVDSPPLRGQR